MDDAKERTVLELWWIECEAVKDYMAGVTPGQQIIQAISPQEGLHRRWGLLCNEGDEDNWNLQPTGRGLMLSPNRQTASIEFSGLPEGETPEPLSIFRCVENEDCRRDPPSS